MMQNGDDDLDDWDKMDEDGLNRSLNKIQAERKLQELQQNQTDRNNTGNSKLTKACFSLPVFPTIENGNDHTVAGYAESTNFHPVKMVLHKDNDEYQGANYVSPTAMQTVKILRRPTQSEEPRNNGPQRRQPIKTLQQREREYAEARLRILGSAKNPEDDLFPSPKMNNVPSGMSASTPNLINVSPPTPSTSQAAAAANKATTTPKHCYNNSPQQQQQQGAHQQHLPNSMNAMREQQMQQQYGYYPQQMFYYHPHQQQQMPPQGMQMHHALHQQPPQYGQYQMPIFNNCAMPPQMSQQRHMQQKHYTPPQQAQGKKQTWSPVVGGSVSSTSLRHKYSPHNKSHNENISRMPRGPDGSTGFQMRR